jgi:hypothetical protein
VRLDDPRYGVALEFLLAWVLAMGRRHKKTRDYNGGPDFPLHFDLLGTFPERCWFPNRSIPPKYLSTIFTTEAQRTQRKGKGGTIFGGKNMSIRGHVGTAPAF